MSFREFCAANAVTPLEREQLIFFLMASRMRFMFHELGI